MTLAIKAELAQLLEEKARRIGIWTPFFGPQLEAYTCEADELFYGGAGGGGKTDLLLGLAITAHRNSIIFRREYGQLRGVDGIWERSRQIIGQAGRPNISPVMRWSHLPGDRAIEFGAMQYEDDKFNYKGRPHDLKGFDELPDFTESQYRFVIGWLRTAYAGQRCRVVSTGNPPTATAGEWVIRYWGPWLDPHHPNPAKPGELRWYAVIDGKDLEVPDGSLVADSTGLMVKPRSRSFIRASVEDNPVYMATGYDQVLNSLPEPLRSQMRFGNFAAAIDDNPWQVIPTTWVRAAQLRWLKTAKPGGPLTALGVDPSRGGKDKFCLAPRWGSWYDQVEKHEATEAPDGKAGASIIYMALRARTPHPLEVQVGIDIIGSAGSSVFDHARELGLQAVGLNGSEKTPALDVSGRLRFFNKRAEWHWRMREHLDPTSGQDLCLPPDPELLADLCAPRWKITPRGIQIEEKDEIKKRLGRSPDVGEAVIYAGAEDSGGGAGFLEYARQQVAGAKASDRERERLELEAAAAEEEANPWLADYGDGGEGGNV